MSYAKDDCLELLDEALSHLEERPDSEHLVELLKGVIGEISEEEGEEPMEKDEEGRDMKDEDDMSDEDLEKEAHKEMQNKPHIMIKIKEKKPL